MDDAAIARFKFYGFLPGISLRRSADGVLGQALAEGGLMDHPSAYVRKVGEGKFMGRLRITIEGGAVEVHAQASSPRKVLRALDARVQKKLANQGAEFDPLPSDKIESN